jgi:hypothetical protein
MAAKIMPGIAIAQPVTAKIFSDSHARKSNNRTRKQESHTPKRESHMGVEGSDWRIGCHCCETQYLEQKIGLWC